MVRAEEPVIGNGRELSWGSDVLADTLQSLGIEYVALVPGASLRGLHDSIVNYGGNHDPQLLLCLHEEHAVAIAHGYAKVKERPMAAALHANVGLMHATMAIFNAFCDRVPMLLIGAAGPHDAGARRPWIDWIHTTADEAALVRGFIKWDDRPESIEPAVDALEYGHLVATTKPRGPVYLCFDPQLQEKPVGHAPPGHRNPPGRPHLLHAPPDVVNDVANLLAASRAPVILMGRVSRSIEAWDNRVRLAERAAARVFTHVSLAAAFPSAHPRWHGASPTARPSSALASALAEADLILSLEWLDLGGTLRGAGLKPSAKVVSVSVEQFAPSGWSKTQLSPAPVDVRVTADPDAVVRQLLDTTDARPRAEDGRSAKPPLAASATAPAGSDTTLRVQDFPGILKSALAEHESCLVLPEPPNGWSAELWPVNGPLDCLSGDGGAGLGSGVGMIAGVALALAESSRLPVGIVGDGEFLMGVTALWTAVHYELPLLIIVANNRSFYNDEIHQHSVAVTRSRPVENRWIGQRIADPAPDLAALARAQGAVAFGPVRTQDELAEAVRVGVQAVAERRSVVVIDAWVVAQPEDPMQSPWVAKAAATTGSAAARTSTV